MKQLFLTLIFINSLFLCYSQALSGKITYQASLNSEEFIKRLNSDSLASDYQKKIQTNNVLTAKPMNFHLLINKNEALFQAEYDLITQRRIGLKQNKTGSVAGHDKIYYSNTQTEENIFQSFWTKEVLVSLKKLDWILTQETKTIGKYICYKATTTINTEQTYGMNFLSPVIAWYTPQIPVPFGVQRFNGLPGLILELTVEYEKGKIHYLATKIELNPEKDIKIKKPKGKKLISEQDYVNLIKNMSRKRN